LNLLKQLSDENKAVTSLSSSYDIYQKDQYGNYVYATDENGRWLYDVDSEGKAIPWQAMKVFYVHKTTGELYEPGSIAVSDRKIK